MWFLSCSFFFFPRLISPVADWMSIILLHVIIIIIVITRMWASAQRDGRPAEHRWRHLLNAAKFGRRPLLDVVQWRCQDEKNRWDLQGCLKLPDRSQPLVGRSSPYCGDMWRTYCCLSEFFSDCRHVSQLRRYSPTNLGDGAHIEILATFLRPMFSASRVQQVSDLHLKFTLRPHHVWKHGRHSICGGWD